MLDLKEERCSVSGEQSMSMGNNSSSITAAASHSSSSSSSGSGSGNSGEIKRCSDCQTTTTPLWRGGPAGPKTLCNACGIKYHKKRRALLGLEKGKVDKSKKKSNSHSSNTNSSVGIPLKIKVMASGIRQRDKLGEVEQAAMLLMNLSYGSVYA